MICPKCKSWVESGYQFCPYCGSKMPAFGNFQPAVEKKPQVPQKPQVSYGSGLDRTKVIVIVLAAVAVIFALTFASLKKQNKEQPSTHNVAASSYNSGAEALHVFQPAGMNETMPCGPETVSSLEQMVIKFYCSANKFTDYFLEYPYCKDFYFSFYDNFDNRAEQKRYVYRDNELYYITEYLWDYDGGGRLSGVSVTDYSSENKFDYVIESEYYVPIRFSGNGYVIEDSKTGQNYFVCVDGSTYVAGVENDNEYIYDLEGKVLKHIYYWEAAGCPVVKYDYVPGGPGITCSYDLNAIPKEYREIYSDSAPKSFYMTGREATENTDPQYSTPDNSQQSKPQPTESVYVQDNTPKQPVQDYTPQQQEPVQQPSSSIPSSTLPDGWYELCAYGDQITDYNGYTVASVDVLRPAIVPDNEATAFRAGDCFSPSKYGIKNMADFIISDVQTYDGSLYFTSNTMASGLQLFHHPDLGGWVPVTPNGEAYYIKGNREYIVFTSSSTVLDEKTSVLQSGQFNRVKINSLRDYFNGYWNTSEKIEVTIRNGIVAEALIPYSLQTIS